MNKKKITILSIIGVLLVALIIGGFVAYNRYQEQKTIDAYNSEVNSLASKIKSFNSDLTNVSIGAQTAKDLKAALSSYQVLKEKNNFENLLNEINYKPQYVKVVKKTPEMLGIDTITDKLDSILKDSDKLLNCIQRSDSIDSEILVLRNSTCTIKQIDDKAKEFIDANTKIKNEILAITIDKNLQESLNFYVNALICRGKYIEEVYQTNINQYDYLVAVEQYNAYVTLAQQYYDAGFYDDAQTAINKANSYKETAVQCENNFNLHKSEAEKLFNEYAIMMKLKIPQEEEPKKEGI